MSTPAYLSTAYYDKFFILFGATFREKLVFHHKAMLQTWVYYDAI